MQNSLVERIKGCILSGAIGDAMGSAFENQEKKPTDVYNPFGIAFNKIQKWGITDDTQLTLATMEAMLQSKDAAPEIVADKFVLLFQQKKLSGLGASTLKALRELAIGAHWSQAGRKGDRAAGNGTAMRIAPLAFNLNITKSRIREVSYLTHQNEEAYIGAICIIHAIRAILNKEWTGKENLMKIIIPKIPDTLVRDRLIEIKDIKDLQAIGDLGNSAYVVNSVPLAIAAANQVSEIGLAQMFAQLIEIGGDTDTNCSIAGQIAGTLIGTKGIPKDLLEQLAQLRAYDWIVDTTDEFVKLFL